MGEKGLSGYVQFGRNFCHTAVYFLDVAPLHRKTKPRIIGHVLRKSPAVACVFGLRINQDLANYKHPRQTAANGRLNRDEQTCTCTFLQLHAAANWLAMTFLQVFRWSAAEFLAACCAFWLWKKVLIRTIHSVFVRGRRLLRRSARSCNRN